jgi:predicted nicotinamide N-methyase
MLSKNNPIFSNDLLNQESNVLELGSGISGLLSLVLAPKVKSYIVTDQTYVLKTLKKNLLQNTTSFGSTSKNKKKSKLEDVDNNNSFDNIIVKDLDWETNSVVQLYSELGLSIDQIHCVIACDCIYNHALIEPLVSTCVDICKLAPKDSPTFCIVVQQLRAPDVFSAWLEAFQTKFHTWSFRALEYTSSADIGQDSGFVGHIGILRDEFR